MTSKIPEDLALRAEIFQENLPVLMKGTGVTQERLAKAIGISRQSMSAIINKKYKLSVTMYTAMLYAFAIYFGVDDYDNYGDNYLEDLSTKRNAKLATYYWFKY